VQFVFQPAAQRLSSTSHDAPTGISTSISFPSPFNRAGGRTSNVRRNMKTLLTFSSLLTLSACSVYKVEAVRDFKPRLHDKPLAKKPPSEPVRLNSPMEGGQCFEPMFYVLSLGIIPSHCVGYYQTGNSVFRVTTMMGWIPAMYPVLSDWEYDLDEKSEMRTLKKLSEQDASGNRR
jgi:hypothetical protein